jgi:hypothetical protein
MRFAIPLVIGMLAGCASGKAIPEGQPGMDGLRPNLACTAQKVDFHLQRVPYAKKSTKDNLSFMYIPGPSLNMGEFTEQYHNFFLQGEFWVADSSKGSSCQIQLSMVTGVYLLGSFGATIAIVRKDHVSNDVTIYRVEDCVKAGEALTGGPATIANGRIIFQSACPDLKTETPDPAKTYSCVAAKAYNLDRNCNPIYSKGLSDRLTKEKLGIAFDGKRQIRFPESGPPVVAQ